VTEIELRDGDVLQGVVVRPDRSSVELPVPDDVPLSEDAQELISRATPGSTERARAGDWGRFERWCADVGYVPLPASPGTLANYVAHLAELGRAPATIARALSSIRGEHRRGGLLAETGEALEALQGYRKRRAGTGLPNARPAEPVTIEHLRTMAEHLGGPELSDLETFLGLAAELEVGDVLALRDRTVLVLGWALFARRSTLSRLNLDDVSETRKGLEVRVLASKADRNAEGRVAALPYGANEPTCPVRTVRAWTALLSARGITSGPLLRRVDRHGRIGGEPDAPISGRGPADGRLSGQAVALVLKRAARASGVTDLEEWKGKTVKAHGLRAGGATGAYLGGANPLQIARHGEGWADGSPTLLAYLRGIDRWKHNALTGAGL
jgi:integrase